LPGFVVIKDSEGTVVNGVRNWGSGFMPAVHQGVEFSSEGVPIKNLDNPKGMSAERQRDKLDLLFRAESSTTARLEATIRNSKPAFAHMNSLTRCRLRRHKRSI
jgi:hypothetical protein